MTTEAKKPHIISDILEKDFQFDEILRSASEAIFDFDKSSRIILVEIGVNRILNEYQVYKKSHIPITTVRRKLIGRGSTTKTLKELECVIHTRGRVTVQDKRENNYSLTLKGMLVSLALSNIFPFEENYLVKKFRNLIDNIFGNQVEISEFILQLIKYNITLFMLWHKINGLELTKHQNLSNYFLEWNRNNSNLSINYPGLFTRNIELFFQFNETRTRFFVLESIVSMLLRKLKANKIEFKWNETGTSDSDFTYNSTSCYNMIKFWPYYIENLQWDDFEPYDPRNIESDNLEVEWNLEDVNELRDKIIAKIKIKNAPVITKQKLIWQ